MGLLDKYREFKENRLKKTIAKHLKSLKNPKAIQEERQAALDFFCECHEIKTAVPSLLQRFDFSLEHGIRDTREKEGAMDGILFHVYHEFHALN